MDANLDVNDTESNYDSNKSISYKMDPNLDISDSESISEITHHETSTTSDSFTFEIEQPLTRFIRRFHTTGLEYRIHFRNIEQCRDLNASVHEAFTRAINNAVSTCSENAQIGTMFTHPSITKPALATFRPIKHLNADTMLQQIEKVLQSFEEITLDNSDAILSFTIVEPPTGSGRHQQYAFIKHDNFVKKKTSIIQIKNNDNLCLARAIVTAIAYLHKNNPIYQWRTIKEGDTNRCTLQKRKAIELMNLAELQHHTGPCGIPELEKIQKVVGNYQIKVFEDRGFKKPIFEGPENQQIIHLFLHNNHYNVITTMSGFFNSGYFCELCNVTYNSREKHVCKLKCPCCYFPQINCIDSKKLIQCNKCNRLFRSEKCLTNHNIKFAGFKCIGKKRIKTESSICDRVKKCTTCNKHMKGSEIIKHQCGMRECRTCKEQVHFNDQHLCYIQPLNQKEEEEDEEVEQEQKNHEQFGKVIQPVYIFFDFETTQDLKIEEDNYGSIYKHSPILCIAHIVCDDCYKNDLSQCKKCGDNRKIFYGNQCLDDFCEFLFSNNWKRVIALAHNAKGYDSQFIIQWLFKQGIKPTIINRGTEIMSLTIGRVKVIDSYNFLPMALADLPKTFNIKELTKGYFPHLFNTNENQNYIGPWPSRYYYNAQSLKGQFKQFTEWYQKQLLKTFNLKEELIQYCESDVDILRRCCLTFRDIFLSITSVDPFDSSLTIASACNKVFRKLFLSKNIIGIVPHNGYRSGELQSIKAIKWLKWVSCSENIYIRHKLNGGEIKIDNFSVDGIYKNNIYEFNGCYWHGCLKCMKIRHHSTANQFTTAREAYEQTIRRRQILENKGYTIIELWECDLEKQLATNEEMRQFFSNCTIMDPLNPRNAFYGGRTNAIKLYHKIKRNDNNEPLQKIHYVDVCSLYPYVNKYGKYPVGHPKIITENFRNVTADDFPYEGVMKIKILPPKRLYHPVLPYRCNNKLLFPLCKMCSDSSSQLLCKHNDNERALIGEWITDEILKSLQIGYKILEIYEVWHYENVEQYDAINNPSGGLFTEYINTFMKIKIESEGWPESVRTENERQNYITTVFNRENIKLDVDNIQKNPGLRAIAKLMLNSFWGKFGQRNNLSKIEYFTDVKDYWGLICNPVNTIQEINEAGPKMMSVKYQQHDSLIQSLNNTNSIIAAYTTTHARLKLYSYLEKLGKRVLYCDTDSIIFIQNLNNQQEYNVPIGWCLGEMTNELNSYGKHAYIDEFVSSGPKSYSFRVVNTENENEVFILKIKGFTLNNLAMRRLNFKSLRHSVRQFVKHGDSSKICITSQNFKRMAETRDVCPNVKFIEGLPDKEELKKTNESKLLILDDMMQEMKSDDRLVQLFTRGSHHWNLSIIHIVQNAFYDGLRTSRINAQYLVLMKNPSDKLQIQNLGRQLFPKSKHFIEAFNDATKHPFGYLLIDLTQTTPENLRLRTNIFPTDKYNYVYTAK